MPVEEPHRVVCHLDALLEERGMTLAALAEAAPGFEAHQAKMAVELRPEDIGKERAVAALRNALASPLLDQGALLRGQAVLLADSGNDLIGLAPVRSLRHSVKVPSHCSRSTRSKSPRPV